MSKVRISSPSSAITLPFLIMNINCHEVSILPVSVIRAKNRITVYRALHLGMATLSWQQMHAISTGRYLVLSSITVGNYVDNLLNYFFFNVNFLCVKSRQILIQLFAAQSLEIYKVLQNGHLSV